MLSIREIKADLREIRYYYSRKEEFDEVFSSMPPETIDVLKKVRRYHAALKDAPAKLWGIFIGLYMNNNTHASLAEELGYGSDYIQRLNKKLLLHLQKNLD